MACQDGDLSNLLPSLPRTATDYPSESHLSLELMCTPQYRQQVLHLCLAILLNPTRDLLVPQRKKMLNQHRGQPKIFKEKFNINIE